MCKIKKLLFVMLLVVILAPFKAKAISENPLTKLEVETTHGTGNFDLSGGKKSFSFSLASSLNYTNIIAVASDPSYVISGAGHVNVKEGQNTINVVVTDPADNSSATYTINLNFKTKGKVIAADPNNTNSDETTNPSTGDFLNYSLIIAGAACGLLLIVKSKKAKRVY